MVLSAGSLLSNALSFRVRARICPNVVSLYGSTEASMIAVAPAHALAHQAGAVGYVLPDVSVEIADAAGNALPAGAEGLVRIRSPYGPGRYLGSPSDRSTAFADGWFYPGDIGRLTPDRLLVITGREKAVMNLGGDKVKPEMVEEVIASFPGIDQAAVFSVINELGIDEMWSLIAPLAQRNEQSPAGALPGQTAGNLRAGALHRSARPAPQCHGQGGAAAPAGYRQSQPTLAGRAYMFSEAYGMNVVDPILSRPRSTRTE